MTLQTYNVNGNLTSVDVASVVNVAGTYFNGPANNGVNSTLTLTNPLPLIIDGVTMENGSEILLVAQSNLNENGIYIFLDGILKRRNDFQCIEQVRGGQYVSVSNGADNKGVIFVVAEPLPVQFGVDPLFILDSTKLIRDFSIDVNSATPGVFFAVTANLTDSQVVNQPNAFLAAINGRVFPSGATSADVLCGLRGGVFATGGTYTSSSGTIAAVYGSLNFESIGGTTINNGGNIYALYGFYEKRFDSSPDPSNFSIIGGENLTTDPVGQMIYFNGRANYLAKINDTAGTYMLTSGTSAGSAGDTTKCNAPVVLKVRDAKNSRDLFIPAFIQNT